MQSAVGKRIFMPLVNGWGKRGTGNLYYSKIANVQVEAFKFELYRFLGSEISHSMEILLTYLLNTIQVPTVSLQSSGVELNYQDFICQAILFKNQTIIPYQDLQQKIPLSQSLNNKKGKFTFVGQLKLKQNQQHNCKKIHVLPSQAVHKLHTHL